jgi:hypothetical protein
MKFRVFTSSENGINEIVDIGFWEIKLSYAGFYVRA